MRLLLVSALLAAAPACGGLPVETNSTGRLTVTGDDAFDVSTSGLGLTRVTGTNASACSARFFDRVTIPNDPSYEFTLGVGPRGKLPAYLVGPHPQGGMTEGPVGASFRLYEGFKDTEHTYRLTSGTVTIDRFDAERITGRFDVQGERSCYDQDKDICRARAVGTFDAKNVDCFPPIN